VTVTPDGQELTSRSIGLISYAYALSQSTTYVCEWSEGEMGVMDGGANGR
jgi:hypothetical protein